MKALLVLMLVLGSFTAKAKSRIPASVLVPNNTFLWDWKNHCTDDFGDQGGDKGWAIKNVECPVQTGPLAC